MKKRVLSAFLSLCMMLTLAPAAFAAETDTPDSPAAESTIKDAASLKSAIESAEAGSTITLGDSFAVEAGPANNFVLNKAITIEGNGNTITRSFNNQTGSDGYGDYEAVFVISVPGVTINNVKMAGLDKGMKDEAGIYISASGEETKGITISNCEFIGAETAEASSGGTGIITPGNAGAYLTVENCSFTNLKYGMYFNAISNASITGNTIDGTKYTGIYLEGSSVTIKDNTLKNIASENYANAAYASGIYVGGTKSDSVEIKDNSVTLCDNATNGVAVVNSKVAQAGETKYATLQEAVSAVGETASISIDLLSDIVLTESVKIPAGKTVTINGNGHTIKYPVSVSAALSGENGIQSSTKLTVEDVNFVISDVTSTPTTGFAVLVGEATNNVAIEMDACSFTNLWCGVYFGHVEPGNTGSIKITDSTYTNTKYGYSVDEVTNGSAVGAVAHEFTDNKMDDSLVESEPWNSVTVTSGTTTKAYGSWADAYAAAQASDTITLNMDVTGPITLEKKVTLDGNGHTIRATASEGNTLQNGALVTVQGDSADGVTIQNLTVDTQGSVKHGVQFYCVTGGKLDNVTVNGGAYTSVIVNGSEATLENCMLNPDEKAYANIEYAMGANVTDIPKIALANVTGQPEKPLVYADKSTADTLNTVDNTIEENATAQEIANAINKNLIGAQVTLVIAGDDGSASTIIPGTKTYTITFNANGHGTNPAATTTNNEGKLATLSPLEKDGRYTFAGWYTAASGGEKVTTDTVFTKDTTLYAHWNYSSGGGGGGGVTTYAVTTNSPANGTVTVSSKSAAKDATVTITVAPASGYQLDKLTVADKDGKGVALTDKGNGKYTFTMPASKVEVTATFKQAPVTHVCPAEKYTDVDTTQWYHEGVDYVIEKGMMNGTGTNTFEPNATTTRGMIVTILYRLEKEPAAGTSPFADVAANQWYAKAVAWAAANGVVNGTSSTTFNPNDPITREQMAAILYRYASFKGYDVTGKADLASYTDASQISDYAKDAMSWANQAGLIGGVSATALQPQGSATRAQVATILMRFCENVAK